MLTTRRALPACIAALCLAAPIARGQFDPQPPELIGFFGLGRTACTDMDADGAPDLVVGTCSSAGFTGAVFFNDGLGGFTLTVADTFLVSDNADVAAGDFDGDGLTDILTLAPVSSSFDELGFVRQVTPGDWQVASFLALSDGHMRIVTCDVNGDSQVDVVIGHPVAGEVEIYLNDGSGSVASLVPVTYAMGTVSDLVCCDLDGDGDPDLASIGASDGILRVRLNTGAGVFGSASFYLIGSTPSSIACSDFDGDALPDLAITRSANDTLAVLLNDGAGGFTSIPPLSTTTGPARVVCGDFDCDGDVDMVVANDGVVPGTLQGFFNDGTGTAWQIGAAFGGASNLKIVDLHAAELDGAAGTDLIATRSTAATEAFVFFNINPACGDCIPPPPDPVAWYDGDLCQPLDVLKNHDGTLMGLGFCPIPKVGGFAMGFSSSPPTYVSIPGECDLAPDDHSYSMTGWVRTNEPGFQPIATDGGAPGFDFSIFDGRLRVVTCDSTFCWLTRSSSFINDGDWHHVAFTLARGPTSTIRVWVDGLLEDTTFAAIGVVDPPHPLLLGASPSPTPSSYFDGAMDEVQVFDRALSAGEIQAMYLAGIAGQCPAGLCGPIGEGESPETQLIEAGIEDDFTLPTEPATPAGVLGGVCISSEDFDTISSDDTVCHTFTDLPDNITGGTLQIRIRASDIATPCNDTIQLQASGSPVVFEWTRRLGVPGSGSCAGPEGLLDCEWSDSRTHTFCLDLAALPEVGGGTTSVIDTMNIASKLDVRIQDDSGVDYMRLRLAVCPCAGDATCDGSVDVSDLLDVLADWGPCPLPCPPCASDVTGDCVVDVADLLLVLGGWGPC